MANFSRTRNTNSLQIGTARTVSVASSAAISDAIDLRGALYGGFITPSALEATTVIGFKVAEEANGTYTPLYDASNALVTVTVAVNASRAYPLPAALFNHRWAKLWTQAAGVDVAQTSARSIIVGLK